jgi:hypothetical protein
MNVSKPRTIGAWVLSHAMKLQKVDAHGQFLNIDTAGKYGLLLSILAGSKQAQISSSILESIAKANGINPRLVLPQLLSMMQERHLVLPSDDGSAYEILGLTHGSVLEKTAALFDELTPDPEERAAIAVSEAVSTAPLRTAELSELISDTFHLTHERTGDFLSAVEQIGFVDAEDLDANKQDKLFFNGNIFRIHDPLKTMKVLQSLSSAEQSAIREFDQFIAASGFSTLDEARTRVGERLFAKLQSIAMFDVNRVANDNDEVLYVTRPAAFAKYGTPWEEDTLDYAKALVASLAYGMTRRQKGVAKIMVLDRLLQKLITGDWVGSTTAAGEDYRYLEFKRVVETKPGRWPGYYDLRLLKPEVGVIALQVLTQGAASSESVLEKMPSSPVTIYSGPEANRTSVRKRKLVEPSDRKIADMLQSIRTGRI